MTAKGVGMGLVVNGMMFPCEDKTKGRRLAALWLREGKISRHIFKLIWALCMEGDK